MRRSKSMRMDVRANAAAGMENGRWLGTSWSEHDAGLDTRSDGQTASGLPGTAVWDPLGIADSVRGVDGEVSLPMQMAMMNLGLGSPSSGLTGGAQQRLSPLQATSLRSNGSNDNNDGFGNLPKKVAIMLALVVFSRLGVYIRLPGVDVAQFSEAMSSGGGLLSYIDTLSGGSISKVGLFSLGIVPYINASILLQLLATAFPSLKKLQREEGPQGRARFTLYQKLAALAFAVVQATGQLSYIRPYVDDWSVDWLVAGVITLTTGAMIMVHVADTITELKLGNGTSILIFANIASALPSSVGAAFTQASTSQESNLAIYATAFLLTTLGIVYVQDAERQIPMQYASRYRAGSAMRRQAYLPFKVNATGVMPVIFSSSLLAVPSALARYAHNPAVDKAAAALAPGGGLYLPTNVALIVAFNYLYTFLQLDPKELSDQLKKQGASIPGVRPGRQTADYITKTLNRISVLGSAFLGALSAAPALVEAATGLQAFRGFAGTSVLILVGVAQDTARRFRAEQDMAKYGDLDQLYDDLKPPRG
jgi:protein transport protein SEC61 subunit alpha